jgi:hypothetical protein
MVFILTPQGVVKSLLEISRINLSTDIFGVLKMNSGELKMIFANRSNSHSMVYTKTF